MRCCFATRRRAGMCTSRAGRDAVHRGADHRSSAVRRSRSRTSLPRQTFSSRIDSDLLSSCPGHLAFARAFADTRASPARRCSGSTRSRATPSLTGAAADHRFVLSHHGTDGAVLLQKLAAILAGEPGRGCAALAAATRRPTSLRRIDGRALVHVGPEQPPEIHALAHHHQPASLGADSADRTDRRRAGRRSGRACRRHAGRVRRYADHSQRQSGL